jgi:carbon monoxide dehydrogenase subunit G
MELTGERLLPVPRERVWAALMDSDTLRAAIPGCEAITPEGDGRYLVSVLAAVGPVKARFKGRLQQQDLQPPHRYTLSFEGEGGVAGFARGSAEVELSEAEGSATRLTYRAQAQIGGRLAQIGSRLVDATAARMSAQFFERLGAVIAPPPAAPQPVPAQLAIPTGFGQPPSMPVFAGATGSADAPLDAAGWGSAVSLTMPAWAWTFSVAVAALLAGWVATH